MIDIMVKLEEDKNSITPAEPSRPSVTGTKNKAVKL